MPDKGMTSSTPHTRHYACHATSMRGLRSSLPRRSAKAAYYFAGSLLLGALAQATAIETSLAYPPTTSRPDKPCQALIRAATGAATPLDKAQLALAAARCAIVRQCAGPLSLELNGLTTDRAALAKAATDGKKYLDIAADALGRLPADVDETRRRTLQDRIDMLRAFADVFLALAQRAGSPSAPADSDDAAQTAKRLTDACVGLAVFVDDPNPGIAQSAKLWQGVAYRQAGRPDRTLNLLLPAIASLRSSRVDFFIRLERCRALSNKRLFIAALSLVMKLEKRVNVWLASEDQQARTRAADSLRSLHADILRRWAVDLRTSGHEDRAKAAEAEMQRVLGDRGEAARIDQLLTLDRTVAGLPAWENAGKAPTTRQAESQ